MRRQQSATTNLSTSKFDFGSSADCRRSIFSARSASSAVMLILPVTHLSCPLETNRAEAMQSCDEGRHGDALRSNGSKRSGRFTASCLSWGGALYGAICVGSRCGAFARLHFLAIRGCSRPFERLAFGSGLFPMFEISSRWTPFLFPKRIGTLPDPLFASFCHRRSPVSEARGLTRYWPQSSRVIVRVQAIFDTLQK